MFDPGGGGGALGIRVFKIILDPAGKGGGILGDRIFGKAGRGGGVRNNLRS
jgi:hypothetical protein